MSSSFSQSLPIHIVITIDIRSSRLPDIGVMLEKAHSLIFLSLTDKVLREVGEETTLAGM